MLETRKTVYEPMDFTHAQREENRAKNLSETILPPNAHRVVLMTHPPSHNNYTQQLKDCKLSDYTNAVYVNVRTTIMG